MKVKTRDFDEYLKEYLKDPYDARLFLEAIAEANDPGVFLEALKAVVEAQGGVGKVSAKAKMSRQNIYRMLAKDGNPEFKSLWTLLKSLGLRMILVPEPGARKAV
jgi:probable addiction module antidote protein